MRSKGRSSVRRIDLAIGIGGAAGQGIATPGDILARIFVRRGLHVNAYNAYQSIIRGGHIFLTLRTSDEPVLSQGDKFDVLVPLNQDTMNRHLRLMRPGSAVLFNSDTIKPGVVADGVQLCPFSVKKLAPSIRGDLVQNTIALGGDPEADRRRLRDPRGDPDAPVQEASGAEAVKRKRRASRGRATTTPRRTSRRSRTPCPTWASAYAFFEGNQALAMGGAAAGVKFYCAYPMSPATGVLHWMAEHARQARHHGAAGRGRDRRRQHGDRRGPRRACARCARPPAAASRS